MSLIFQKIGEKYILGLFCYNIWTSVHGSKWGWFRIFGYGLKWKHESRGLLFSERNGYKKYIKIGKWYIGYLPKNKS